MKHLIKIQAFLLAAGCLGICSCSDEEFMTDELNPFDASVSENTKCFTPDYCVIWDVKDIPSNSLELTTDEKVTVTDSKSLLTFSQENTGNGKSVIIPHVKAGVSLEDIFIDDLIISSARNPEARQSVKAIIRDVTPANSTREGDNTEDPIKRRVAEAFSKGYKMWSNIGAQSQKQLLETDLLYNKHNAIMYQPLSGSIYYQDAGNTVMETTSSQSHKFGVGGGGTLAGGILGISLNGHVSKDEQERNETEYVQASKLYFAVTGHLDMNVIGRSADSIVKYMSGEVNEILNKTNSDRYKLYANDDAGIFKLLDDYGDHIATGGTFGAILQYMYSCKKSVSKRGCTWGLSVSAKYAQEAKKKMDSDKKWDSIYQKCPEYLKALVSAGITPDGTKGAQSAFDINGEYGNEFKFSDYISATNSKWYLETFGGNSNTLPAGDYSKFIATDDPKKWVLISYKYATGISHDLTETAEFIPLYELCNEPNRKAAITKALTPVYDGELKMNISPYFKYKAKVYQPKNAPKVVLADFQPVYGNAPSSARHPKDMPRPKFLEGPDGKIREYFPLMATEFGDPYYDVAPGYPFDMYWYIGNSRGRGYLTFYYALDYEDQCRPIQDIAAYRSNSYPTGWIPRGHKTNHQTSSNWDRFVYVKLVPEGDKTTPRVTGVAIRPWKHSGKTLGHTKPGQAGWWTAHNLPIAVTGGTEMPLSPNNDQKLRFLNYWPSMIDKYMPWIYNENKLGRRIYDKNATLSNPLFLDKTYYNLEPDVVGRFDAKGEYIPSSINQPLKW